MSARGRKHAPAFKAKVALTALREEATVVELAARSVFWNIMPISAVRREKALVHRGWKSLPGAGSFRPVTIEAVVEVTKLLKPSVKKVAMATQ